MNESNIDPVEKYEPEYHNRSEDDLYKLGEKINMEIDYDPDLKDFPYDIYEDGSDDREAYKIYLTKNKFHKNLRDEEVKPNHRIIVKLIVLEQHLFVLHDDMYLYDDWDGTYHKDDGGKRTKRIISSYLHDKFSEIRTIEAIYKLLCIQASIQKSDEEINNRPRNWIHFLNGYLDPDEMSDMIPHDPDYYDTNVIPYNYDPDRYDSNSRREKGRDIPLVFDSVFNADTMGGEDNLNMLLQYIGYSMTLETGQQKFLMLVGSGGTGKSTILSLVEKILGSKNVSHVSLQGLQERFTKSSLYLKQANICADLPLTPLKEVDDIKKLTGEDTIFADRKNQKPLEFVSYARLFFSANDVPLNLADKSNAFFRRLLILEMNRKPEQIDLHLGEKLEKEIPNIITKVVEAWHLSEGRIEESKRSKELVSKAYKDADSVEAFLADRCEKVEGNRIPKTTLYDDYKMYCNLEGRQYLSARNFYKALEGKGFRSGKSKYRYIEGLEISKTIQLYPTNNESNSQ